jgi:sulfoxide reductase heme-binding subunit YedZ
MTLLPRKLLKPVVFILCLLPLLWLGWRGIGGQLGANPVEAVIRFLGDWALRFLFITLAMSPLRLLTGWSWPISLRRMLGLYAFFLSHPASGRLCRP